MGRKALEPGTIGKIKVNPEVRNGVETGRFYARVAVRRGDGSRTTLRAYRRTKTAAREDVQALALVEARKWAAGDDPGAPTAGDITDGSSVADLCRAYVDDGKRMSKWSAATIGQYEGTLRRNIVPGLGELTVRELTTRSANAFFRTLKPGAWKSAQSILSGAYRWAIGQELIGDHDPIRNALKPPRRRPRKETATARQVRQFVDAATAYSYPPAASPAHRGPTTRKPWLAPLIVMSAATGARMSELVSLKWEHLHRVDDHGQPVAGAAWTDQTAGRLAVTLQGAKARKGTGSYTDDEGKDVHPRRLVLPEFAEDALREWSQRQDFPGGWVFPTATGTHIPSSSVYRGWRTLREEMGEDGKPDPTSPARNHVLRHTAITQIANDLAGGGSLDLAAYFAGHRRPGVTDAVYRLPGLVDASQILNRWWTSGATEN